MLKKCLVIIAAAIIFITPAKALAYTQAEVDYAAAEYSLVMELILDNYVGSDISIEELKAAAYKGMFNALDEYSEVMSFNEFDQLVDSLNDNFVGIGVIVNLSNENCVLIEDTLQGSPAEKAGIKAGDVIIQINEVPISDMPVTEVTERLRGKEGTVVNVTIRRETSELHIPIKREKIEMSNVEYKKIDEVLPEAKEFDNSHMRYVKIKSFDEKTAEDFIKAIYDAKFHGVKVLLMDLRGNTGGLLESAIKICQEIIPEGPIIYTKDKKGNISVINSALKEPPFKIVLLIDGFTASASEVVASAIKDSQVGTLVGGKTFGKGVGQGFEQISKNSLAKITIEEFFSRNQAKINTVGISPHVEVYTPSYSMSTYGYIGKYSSTEEINGVKAILNFLGYPAGDLTGIYDDSVKESVKEFQALLSLDVTGQVDQDTEWALNYALSQMLAHNDIVLQKGYELAKEL